MNSSYLNRSHQETLIQKVVRLEYESSPHQQMFKVYLQYLTNTREINFSKALKDIDAHGTYCSDSGYPIDNSQIFYWDYNKKMFVYVGNYPFKQECLLKYENFQEKIIHLRVRRIGKPIEPRNEHCRETSSTSMEVENCRNKNEKRVKERSIQEVIEKVSLWRRLYQGVDMNGKKNHTLESAARQVGIAKKTLDDYFLHLRLAQKHNFDFQAHRNAKIGVLRTFVKQNHKGVKVEPKLPSILDDKIIHGPAAIKTQIQSVQQSAASSSDEETQPYLFHRQDSFSD